MNRNVKKKIQEVVDRNEKGYTLIELIVAIVIMGIISAIAIPNMSKVSDVDIYATTRQIKSDIRLAQQLAMTKFMNTTIAFNDGAGTFYGNVCAHSL